LRRSLTDAETGQRGYLLTDRNEYLKPTSRRTSRWINRSSGCTTITPTTRVARAAAPARRRRARQAVGAGRDDAAARPGRRVGWRNILLSNIGEEQMDTVRRLSEALMSAQTERIDASRRSVMRTLQFNRWVSR